MDLEVAENFKLIILPDVKENMYYISTTGEIYSTYKKSLMIPKEDKDGYYEISLRTRINSSKTWKVHKLVALTYIGTPPDYLTDPTVDHIDSNIKNNDYTNLRWINREINSSIRKNKGTGEQNHEAILTEKQVVEICELLTQKVSLIKIAQKYGVEKSTISNIRRKKTWTHLTKCYEFEKNEKANPNSEININRKNEIINFLKNNFSPRDIIKMGYPDYTVYKYNKIYKEQKSLIVEQYNKTA